MTMTQERKQELVAKFGDNEADTGKTEVQVALLAPARPGVRPLERHVAERRGRLAPRRLDRLVDRARVEDVAHAFAAAAG